MVFVPQKLTKTKLCVSPMTSLDLATTRLKAERSTTELHWYLLITLAVVSDLYEIILAMLHICLLLGFYQKFDASRHEVLL